MIPIDAQTPLDVFEFDALVYYPESTELFPYGVVVKRLREFQFAIGCLNFKPMPRVPNQEELFLKTPGFLWTCPTLLKEKFLDNQVTIRDVLSHYLQANIEIGLINTAFQPLNVSALLELFPRELLIIPPLKTELLEESKTLQEVRIHESIFFKDSYGGEWILNRNNISTVCLIRIALQTDPIKLKILSQAYIMNEMTLNLVRENENPDEWDQLTLRELLELKNWLENYTAFHLLSKPYKDAFRTHSIEDVEAWISMLKFSN